MYESSHSKAHWCWLSLYLEIKAWARHTAQCWCTCLALIYCLALQNTKTKTSKQTKGWGQVPGNFSSEVMPTGFLSCSSATTALWRNREGVFSSAMSIKWGLFKNFHCQTFQFHLWSYWKKITIIHEITNITQGFIFGIYFKVHMHAGEMVQW